MNVYGTEEIVAITSAAIAFISMLITIVLFYFNYRQVSNLNNVSLNSKYFEKIFDKHLIDLIPNTRKYIRFQNDKLVDTSKLVDELSKLRVDALYFKYSNKEFYSSIKSITQEIENYLMECGNSRFESEEQADVYVEIHKKISRLYKIINDAYLGTK